MWWFKPDCSAENTSYNIKILHVASLETIGMVSMVEHVRKKWVTLKGGNLMW